ncbi:putative disease resistance protein rga4 [Quercus suber]|uniref:Disease resistance protein rga4 n=1 Tax=Quercus suber TaxID=58331 RepID=A0AAW0KIE3_QUESU
MEWRHLNRLTRLQFYDLPRLNSLPVGLQHVTTLETLFIGNCENLKTLPRWIGNLISLKQFTIYNCLNLKSLPEGMRDLSSLQTLRISNCPELQRRCEKETDLLRSENWCNVGRDTKEHDLCTWFLRIEVPVDMVEQYQDGSCGGKGGRHLLKLGQIDEESHSKDWARLEDKQIRRWAKCSNP